MKTSYYLTTCLSTTEILAKTNGCIMWSRHAACIWYVVSIANMIHQCFGWVHNVSDSSPPYGPTLWESRLSIVGNTSLNQPWDAYLSWQSLDGHSYYVDLSPERLLNSLVPKCPCAIFVNMLGSPVSELSTLTGSAFSLSRATCHNDPVIKCDYLPTQSSVPCTKPLEESRSNWLISSGYKCQPPFVWITDSPTLGSGRLFNMEWWEWNRPLISDNVGQDKRRRTGRSILSKPGCTFEPETITVSGITGRGENDSGVDYTVGYYNLSGFMMSMMAGIDLFNQLYSASLSHSKQTKALICHLIHHSLYYC